MLIRRTLSRLMWKEDDSGTKTTTPVFQTKQLGFDPLHCAVVMNNIECANLECAARLNRHWHDPDARTSEGRIPLCVTAAQPRTICIVLVVQCWRKMMPAMMHSDDLPRDWGNDERAAAGPKNGSHSSHTSRRAPVVSSLQRRLNFYCQIIIILLAMIALQIWSLPSAGLLQQAQAQLPNSAEQRIDLIKASRQTNKLLREIHATLKSTLKVKVQNLDQFPASKASNR